MAFDVLQQAQSGCGGVSLGRHLEIEYRNIRLVERRASNRGLEIVCGYYVVFVTQRPIQLLRNRRIIVNNQNPGLHRRLRLQSVYRLTDRGTSAGNKAGFGTCNDFCL